MKDIKLKSLCGHENGFARFNLNETLIGITCKHFGAVHCQNISISQNGCWSMENYLKENKYRDYCKLKDFRTSLDFLELRSEAVVQHCPLFQTLAPLHFLLFPRAEV